MLSLGSITSILFLLAPWLVPKAIAYYRSVKANSHSPDAPIRPTPRAAKRALHLLTIACILALINTLPYFAPTEIFSFTNSRLELPTNLIFSRLASFNNPPVLSEAQTTLRKHLNSKESRLLYFKYGPDVMTYCTFCNPEDPSSYLFYAIPSILAPHLLHLGILAVSTSRVFAGPEARRWRKTATWAGVAIAVAELFITYNYNYTENSRVPRGGELYKFYWQMRIYRSIAFAGTTAALGYMIYLTSTNAAFVQEPSAAQDAEGIVRKLHTIHSNLDAITLVRNATLRDRNLKSLVDQYWMRAADFNDAAMQDKEVMQAIQNALSDERRLPMDRIQANAEDLTERLFAPYLQDRVRI